VLYGDFSGTYFKAMNGLLTVADTRYKQSSTFRVIIFDKTKKKQLKKGLQFQKQVL